MSNLPPRSLPQRRSQPRPGRTAGRFWRLALLALASAGLLGACVLEHDPSSGEGWGVDTQESAVVTATCEPSTNPAVARRQALAAVTSSNQFGVDPATGQTTTGGCLGSNPSHCIWLCQDGDPLDDADNCSGTLCCPGCGGGTSSTGGTTDEYPCD